MSIVIFFGIVILAIYFGPDVSDWLRQKFKRFIPAPPNVAVSEPLQIFDNVAVSEPLQIFDVAVDYPDLDLDGILEFKLTKAPFVNATLYGQLRFCNQIYTDVKITKFAVQITNISLHNRQIAVEGGVSAAVTTVSFDLTSQPIELPTVAPVKEIVLPIPVDQNWLETDRLRVQVHILCGCRGTGAALPCCWIKDVKAKT